MASPALAETIRIETGSADDLDSVMHVMDSAFGNRFGEAWSRSQLSGILPLPGVSLTLARNGQSDRTIGFALCRSVAGEAELLLIAVLPHHHRCGVGRKLLDDFSRRARESRIEKIHLEVRDGNPAIAMYRDAGFSTVGRRRNYYHSADGEKFDAITLACQL